MTKISNKMHPQMTFGNESVRTQTNFGSKLESNEIREQIYYISCFHCLCDINRCHLDDELSEYTKIKMSFMMFGTPSTYMKQIMQSTIYLDNSPYIE